MLRPRDRNLLCRLAGGIPPGNYGPNREEMAAMRERMKTAKLEKAEASLWRPGLS